MFGTLRDLANEIAMVHNRSDTQSYVDLLSENILDRPLSVATMKEAKASTCHIRSAREREFVNKYGVGAWKGSIVSLQGEALTERLQIAFLQQVEDQLDTALHQMGADSLI